LYSIGNIDAANEIWSKSVQRFSRYAQKKTNSDSDNDGPVVSHIDNLNMWLISVGDGHTSNEIWLKSIQGFSLYEQTIKTDNKRDSSRRCPSTQKSDYVGVCYR
jgi:hypothetical protein